MRARERKGSAPNHVATALRAVRGGRPEPLRSPLHLPILCAYVSPRGGGWTRTGPLAACTTFVETLPSLIRPITPRSRLPTASKVLYGASSSAASRREAAASPTIRGSNPRPAASTSGNRG